MNDDINVSSFNTTFSHITDYVFEWTFQGNSLMLLSELTGIAPGRVYEISFKNDTPTVLELLKLSIVFNCSMEDLIDFA